MRTTLSLALSCLAILLAPSAFAIGDVSFTSIAVDHATAETGSDITIISVVRNNGPDAAEEVNVDIGNNYAERMYVLSSAAPAGWQCSTGLTACWTSSMPAGAQVELKYHVLLPATVRPAGFKITGHLSATNGGSANNNDAEIPVTLTPSSRVADLSLTLSAPPNPVAQGTAVTLAYDVRNNGPQDLNDVRIDFYVPGVVPAVTFDGAGWTCGAYQTFWTTCKRSSLGSGANAPLSAQFVAPSKSIEFEIRADAYSAQAHLDTNPSNSTVWRTFYIGSASQWSRILVPLAPSDIAGANGSLWKSEIRGVIESASTPEMVPNGCGGLEDPCGLPPLNRTFDAANEELALRGFGPQFIYVAREAAPDVHFTTRVYDASKSEATAGAIVPMPRDEQFSARGFTLVGIPSAPQFRATLRIYDATGAEGLVDYELYGDDASTPFAGGVWPLETPDGQQLVTTALLPQFPASAQVDLTPYLAGHSQLRVRIRPHGETASEPAMSLWGFVSITNNQTSHVTVVTP